MSKQVAIIGDVHGLTSQYVGLVKPFEYSLQIGDMGFDYGFFQKELNENVHCFFAGNHDNYDEYYNCPNGLLDYGNVPYIHNSFFMRGGYSIDWEKRLIYERAGFSPKTFWTNEELNFSQLNEAYEFYCYVRPKMVFTHEAPRSVVNNVTDGRVLKRFGLDPETFTTNTSECLDKMFQYHKPQLWIFGHYHRSVEFKVGGTTFICLAELERKILRV